MVFMVDRRLSPKITTTSFTILSTLGPNHALTVLFLGTHTGTSQWVTYLGNALARTRLTSEFRWNLKLVSSQKTSCYRRWACTYKAHHPLFIGRCGMLQDTYLESM
ncbi:hypothetical protein DVH24_028499 [Malus domestica]|uniref:Uncharacterized protein n=1 Tax=Malus domestica TaxID=3750 RepID=A0A498IUJ8_MALDO|nr:hypothetical protein DVH24_028499 [Malus domestica]